jgi:hypothetical protein
MVSYDGAAVAVVLASVNDGIRTLLFALVLIAVVLLLVGGGIALFTLVGQRRASETGLASIQLENESA